MASWLSTDRPLRDFLGGQRADAAQLLCDLRPLFEPHALSA